MKLGDRIEKWADGLTATQTKDLMMQLVELAVESEDIRFWEDSLAPYWDSCGEPLVEGQDCYEEELEDYEPPEPVKQERSYPERTETCWCGCGQIHAPLPQGTRITVISGWHRVRLPSVRGQSCEEIGCGNDPALAVEEAIRWIDKNIANSPATSYKVVGRYRVKEKQCRWVTGKPHTQYKKSVYASKIDFDKYSPELIDRWSKLNMTIEVYQMIDGKWVMTDKGE